MTCPSQKMTAVLMDGGFLFKGSMLEHADEHRNINYDPSFGFHMA